LWARWSQTHLEAVRIVLLSMFIIAILNQATGQVCGVYFPSECSELQGKSPKEGLDKFFPKSVVGQFEKVRPSAAKAVLIQFFLQQSSAMIVDGAEPRHHTSLSYCTSATLPLMNVTLMSL
jgi:hypothetical protein